MLRDQLPAHDYRSVRFAELWRLGGLSPWDLVRRTIAGYREHKLELRAVYFAFYALYSLAPLLIVAVSTVALVPHGETSESLLTYFLSAVEENTPGDGRDLISREIEQIQHAVERVPDELISAESSPASEPTPFDPPAPDPATAEAAERQVEAVKQELEELGEAVAPKDRTKPSAPIKQEVEQIESSTRWWVILIGWTFMLYSGRTMLLTVSSGLDAAYGVDRERRRVAWRRNLVAVGVLVGAMFLLLLSLAVQIPGAEAIDWLADGTGLELIRTLFAAGLRWLIVVCFLLAATSLVYTYVPTPKVAWTPLSPGGALFAVAWIGATQSFSYYLTDFTDYSKTYGVLAGFVVLMTWLWMTGSLLLVGGQLNSVIHRHVLAAHKEEWHREHGDGDAPDYVGPDGENPDDDAADRANGADPTTRDAAAPRPPAERPRIRPAAAVLGDDAGA